MDATVAVQESQVEYEDLSGYLFHPELDYEFLFACYDRNTQAKKNFHETFDALFCW